MSKDLNRDSTLVSCLFRFSELTKNVKLDKYKYSRYGIGFDSRSEFKFADVSVGKSMIIFGAGMSLSLAY